MDREKLIATINKIDKLQAVAGAFKIFFFCGDTDDMLNIFDFLEKIEYIIQITDKENVRGQDQVYIKNINYKYQ